MAVFGVPTFSLITGASRGIGRGIAVSLAEKVGENSLLVLTARSEEGLKETKRLIEERRGAGLEVRLVVCDLSDSSGLDSGLSAMFSGVINGTYQHAILMNNAASVDDVTKTLHQQTSPEKLENYFTANVISIIRIISTFIEAFPQTTEQRRTVVNITSGGASRPCAGMSLYCSSKAAKQMLFKVLAVENPSMRILNYMPGPVDTDTHTYLRECVLDLNVRQMLVEWHSKKLLITPEKTAAVLMTVLQNDSFENGSCVDYNHFSDV